MLQSKIKWAGELRRSPGNPGPPELCTSWKQWVPSGHTEPVGAHQARACENPLKAIWHPPPRGLPLTLGTNLPTVSILHASLSSPKCCLIDTQRSRGRYGHFQQPGTKFSSPRASGSLTLQGRTRRGVPGRVCAASSHPRERPRRVGTVTRALPRTTKRGLSNTASSSSAGAGFVKV